MRCNGLGESGFDQVVEGKTGTSNRSRVPNSFMLMHVPSGVTSPPCDTKMGVLVCLLPKGGTLECHVFFLTWMLSGGCETCLCTRARTQHS